MAPLGGRRALRLVAVRADARARVGGRAVHHVLALGVPALPARLQAHRARPVGGLRRQRRQRADRGRGVVPGHVHPRRPPGASILREARRMARSITTLVLAALSVGLTFGGADAADKVRVVTTIPDLKALSEAVGGDLADVESLTRGTQNFHEAEVRPSMMLKLRKRSEEHTSELQSPYDLVCRLL